MTTTKAPLAWTNCNVTVTLTQLETGVWRVQTTLGGFVLDAWSRSYGDETTARSAARHVACAARQWKTIRNIEAEDERLRFKVRDLLNSRRDTRQQLADTEAALAAIADLNLWGQTALIAA